MERWRNKVAVVTGANSGIGAACVKDLLKAGLIVVGLDRTQVISNSVPEDQRSRLHSIKCDVTSESEVTNSFEWIDSTLGGADILVNNAGIVRTTELVQKDNTKDIKDTIETNVLGAVYCIREYFNSMIKRNVNVGHVVIINGVVGHIVPNFPDFPSGNIYPPTSFALTAMTEVYRQEFARYKTNIKISSISPGVVNTKLIPDYLADVLEDNIPMLKPENVSDAVLYVIGTPPHVQVHELIIKPLGEKC